MFKLEFETSNAAFTDDDFPGSICIAEVARILTVIAGRVRDGSDEGKAYDINGNAVGAWSLTDEEDE